MPGSFLPENYLPVAIFLAIAFAFGMGTLLIGTFLRPRHLYPAKLKPYESGAVPFSDARIPFPMRYYVIAMLFVIFDIETVFMYPWAVVFDRIGFIGLVEMVIFVLILFVGFVYAWRKGALEWD